MNPRAAHFGAEEVDLRNVEFTPELLACVPAESARRYRVLPVSNSAGVLRLALADPSDLEATGLRHDVGLANTGRTFNEQPHALPRTPLVQAFFASSALLRGH